MPNSPSVCTEFAQSLHVQTQIARRGLHACTCNPGLHRGCTRSVATPTPLIPRLKKETPHKERTR